MGKQSVAVVIHEDTHADVEVTVFSTPPGAIAYAMKTAREMDRYGDLVEKVTPRMAASGWLYNARYGESNHIRVQMRDVIETEVAPSQDGESRG